MHRTYYLIVMALLEGATGLILLVWPFVGIVLIAGVKQAAPETILFARIAGAGLLAFGVSCWAGRSNRDRATQTGVLLSALVYNLAATGVLAYAAWFSRLNGTALWRAVVLHGTLAVWCIACFWDKPRGGDTGTRALT
jgi:hypothetical protein